MRAGSSELRSEGDRRSTRFIVRKEPKGHGTGQWIEGRKTIPDGSRVAVIEDVVTTGGSALKAIERCRVEKLEPVALPRARRPAWRAGARRSRRPACRSRRSSRARTSSDERAALALAAALLLAAALGCAAAAALRDAGARPERGRVGERRDAATRARAALRRLRPPRDRDRHAPHARRCARRARARLAEWQGWTRGGARGAARARSAPRPRRARSSCVAFYTADREDERPRRDARASGASRCRSTRRTSSPRSVTSRRRRREAAAALPVRRRRSTWCTGSASRASRGRRSPARPFVLGSRARSGSSTLDFSAPASPTPLSSRRARRRAAAR